MKKHELPDTTAKAGLLTALALFVVFVAATSIAHYVHATPSVVRATASVVEIRTSELSDAGLHETCTGSGVIVDARGYILTCEHVVSGAAQIMVDVDGFRSRATVVAFDADLDLALLKVNREFPLAAPWGSSKALHVGDPVYAIGFPFDTAKMLRRGTLAGLDYNIEYNSFMVTDAQVNPGDSGGALFNEANELVGIPARIQTAQGFFANIGMSYVIPGDVAHWFVKEHIL